jgi:V8-like Glu-specific endopeptidase
MNLARSIAFRVVVLSAALSAPAAAIVVSGSNPGSAAVSYGQTVDGVNLSGVVEVTSGVGGCSGSLLSDGLTILTAGHCVTTAYGQPIATNITVTFNGPEGGVPYTVSTVSVDPAYTGDSTQGGDLAVLTLSAPAPSFALGYGLYTGAFTTSPDVIAGYGLTGTGLAGANGTYGALNAGENAYIFTGDNIGWSSTLLIGEFYEAGVTSTNALSAANPYDASDEVDISHGDSGGPSFYDGQIVGVHDLIACVGSNGCTVPPAVNSSNNSYFGDVFADVSAGDSASWIASQEVLSPEPSTALLLLAACAMCRRRFRLR